jgi:hypothetical protein
MPKAFAAFAPLPLQGQLAFARSKATTYVEALAVSPYLDPSVASHCLNDIYSDKLVASPSTCWHLISKIDDVGLIDFFITNGSTARASSAARNPAATVESLRKALDFDAGQVRFTALLNESTPLDMRLEYGTTAVFESMVNIGPSLGHTVVRAAEAVLTNHWIAQDPVRFSRAFHRAIVCSPASSLEEISAARACSRGGLKFVQSHPLRKYPGISWTNCTVAELLTFAHPASDLAALARPEMTMLDASRIFARREPLEPEPHVIARLIGRFGFMPLIGLSEPLRYALSRTSSAAWVHPAAKLLQDWSVEDSAALADAAQACDLLANNAEAWSTFVSLLPNWNLGFVPLATTALRLYR